MARDFNELPYEPGQAIVHPSIVVALETNLLTEDNLPYYHARIENMVDADSVYGEWNRLWTAEEANHADVIRDYLIITRAMDPRQMEENRFQIMQAGFARTFADPFELFAYTSIQELATRVSHLRAGQAADEPVALKIFSGIANDENHHYIFYRSLVKEALALEPDIVIEAICNQFYSFQMPGTGMTNFELRQAMIADAGIYGAREHRDLIVKPLLSYFKIEDYEVTTAKGAKAKERLLKIEKVLDRMVEKQDRQNKKTD